MQCSQSQGLTFPQKAWPEQVSTSCHTFQEWPAQPGCPILLHMFPSSSVLHIFSTCSAQHISWSLPHTQESTNHFSRQKGGWGSGHLLSAAASQWSTASPAPSPQYRACRSILHLCHGLDQLITHTVASPSNGLVQSQPGELRAASLF